MSQQSTASETLSATQQVIPLIGCYVATSRMELLENQLELALNAGLTLSEAKEILVQLYAYCGFPRSLNALGLLMKVTESRKQRGVQDDEGAEPSAPVPVGEALQRLGYENQSIIAGGPVAGALFDFVPVINQFLQSHLFGDIFARDNLDWQSRELATVGALAATEGAESQLLAHTRACLRVGLSTGQLYQLVEVLRPVDNSAALRAEAALHQASAA
ncbi:carboxymuconolactone decarboxylase family protein [Tatumella sp. UBA2305]|uniref:carboxymuconolactone decarboxylase family protein n=1 Tax=Tatumella sp. UBA2305 TaxID=1947647 RepID=UPI0025DFACA7|nr:carboxymuconolactone decarboxylase family protein [Tatumella sp. UBA2305]